MSIPNDPRKIKKIVGLGAISVLSITLVAGLTQIYTTSAGKSPLAVKYPIATTERAAPPTEPEVPEVGEKATGAYARDQVVEVVASKKGGKYHLPTCPGAKAILPENKIVFASPKDAETAGYSRARNCRGLEIQSNQ